MGNDRCHLRGALDLPEPGSSESMFFHNNINIYILLLSILSISHKRHLTMQLYFRQRATLACLFHMVPLFHYMMNI